MDINSVINYLYTSNKETEKTLISGFINEITIKYLPLYVLETFALNKEAQEIIINLSEQNIKNISKIINYAENENQDWISLCANYYHFLKNKQFSNLIDDVSKNDLSESQIKNLLFVISNGGNYFDINSVDDLNNLQIIRDNKNSNNNVRI